jgi:SAM-dependent methyltransferase
MKYQDLVIKDNNFIGEFEKMYQEFSDPWNQSEEVCYSSLSRRSVCYFLEKFDINSIVEWGCGLGKTVNYIKENTGKDVDILGIDISKTAIDKAKNFYPKLDFKVDNILNISQYNNFDCMFFAEITWYLLEEKKLDKIFNIMSKNFKGKNKFFIHNLSFYEDGIQQYGKDYFATLDEFIEFCPFELLEKVQVDSKDGIASSAIFKI